MPDGPVTPMAASPGPAVALDVGSSVWAASSPSTSAPEEKAGPGSLTSSLSVGETGAGGSEGEPSCLGQVSWLGLSVGLVHSSEWEACEVQLPVDTGHGDAQAGLNQGPEREPVSGGCLPGRKRVGWGSHVPWVMVGLDGPCRRGGSTSARPRAGPPPPRADERGAHRAALCLSWACVQGLALKPTVRRTEMPGCVVALPAGRTVLCSFCEFTDTRVHRTEHSGGRGDSCVPGPWAEVPMLHTGSVLTWHRWPRLAVGAWSTGVPGRHPWWPPAAARMRQKAAAASEAVGVGPSQRPPAVRVGPQVSRRGRAPRAPGGVQRPGPVLPLVLAAL